MTTQVQADALIDPELRPLAAQMAPIDLSREALPSIRSAFAEMIAAGPAPALDGVSVEERTIERTGAPPLRLLHYRPTGKASSSLPAILHMHGGGFILGLPEMNHSANVVLARDLLCHVVSVDYRLAPEHPYPAALDDCMDALDWLFRNANGLGVDPTRIGVKGESAGGGLAAALVLRERDRGNDRIAFQHLIYPMLDDRTGSVEPVPDVVGTVAWNIANNRFAWECLLGQDLGEGKVPPFAAPARESRLVGLPPTYLSVGALDLFLSEGIAFAERLRHWGVEIELHVYPGAFHGFDAATDARVARDANATSRRALERSLHG